MLLAMVTTRRAGLGLVGCDVVKCQERDETRGQVTSSRDGHVCVAWGGRLEKLSSNECRAAVDFGGPWSWSLAVQDLTRLRDQKKGSCFLVGRGRGPSGPPSRPSSHRGPHRLWEGCMDETWHRGGGQLVSVTSDRGGSGLLNWSSSCGPLDGALRCWCGCGCECGCR